MDVKESNINKANDHFEEKKSKDVTIRRIWVYLVIFLFIGIPVAVGILVWHFVSSSYVPSESIYDRILEDSTTTQITKSTLDPNIGQVWDKYRLPRDVIPSHYNLTLYPDFYEDNAWFRGSEVIEVEVVRPTQLILIHSRNINITDVAITDIGNGLSVDIVKQFTYVKYDYLVLELASAFDSGTHLNMAFTFEGSLSDKIASFYKSTYTTSTGEQRHIASTQMEPAFAREVFPCFDEPDMKANFSVTLIHSRGYTALSNMPEEDINPSAEDPDMLATRFQTSDKMSTYLACFIVCDFDHIQNYTANGHLVRLWGPSERIHQLKYSLNISLYLLDFLEDYFDIPYPLPKQDLIAIPNFVSGGMENWGIITFRDTFLMIDPLEGSRRDQQVVTSVVSHELAHNWFGNLVTMSWWSDAWLNEGFASYFGIFAVDNYRKDWNYMKQQMAMAKRGIMITDAMDSSRPVIVPLARTSGFYSAFDPIAYFKGASLVHMMSNIMGVDNFKHVMQTYLKNNVGGNTDTDDMWTSFSEIEGVYTTKTIMDTWTLQMGYPYVDVKFFVDDLGNTKVSATQQRFKLQDAEQDVAKSPYNFTWYIPLDYITSLNVSYQQRVWMNRTAVEFEVHMNMSAASTWIKLNYNQIGYYRVNYPDEIWHRFSETLQNNVKALSALDRANLLDDAFSLAQAGIINYTTAFDLTTYMNQERSYLPWYTFIRNTAYIRNQFVNKHNYQLLRTYVISKARKAMDNLGWKLISDYTDAFLQLEMISLMCEMREPECLSNATECFHQWIANGQPVDPELRRQVYAYGMHEGGTVGDWNKVMDWYLSERIPQEKDRLLYALTQTKHLDLILRLLNLALNESVVKSQDVFKLFAYTSYNVVGHELVWLWLRANWQTLIDKFSIENPNLGRITSVITAGFNTDAQLKEVEYFFKQYPDAGERARFREQILDSIRGNINWQKTHYHAIADWLREHTVL